MQRTLLRVAAAISVVGCASGTGGTGGPAHSSSVLTSAEITAFNPEGKTAFDIVSRLRPKWLLARGVQSMIANSDSSEYALVVVDGRSAGRPNALREIPADQIDAIHYIDPAEVGGKYGPRGTSGVIQVSMKRASRN